jgi:hypothetical protein
VATQKGRRHSKSLTPFTLQLETAAFPAAAAASNCRTKTKPPLIFRSGNNSVVIEYFRTMFLCAAKLRVPVPRNVVRTYMSTLTQAAPHDDECLFMLILGKPGGGKGTISEKILKVSYMLDERCATVTIWCLHF